MKKQFWKKGIALMLCVSMLGVHCVSASETKGAVKDDNGNKIGTGYLSIEGEAVTTYTKSVKSSGVYKYKNKTEIHVYYTCNDTRYAYDASSKVVPAKSTEYSGNIFLARSGIDVMAATSTHIIWKSGVPYKKVLHQ